MSTRSDLAALNARFFRLCRERAIQPPLDEHGELTDAGWLDAVPREVAA
jgi:hypothetical protein